MVELKSSPALVVVDMQNAFCNPQGSLTRGGWKISHFRDIIPAINRLIDLCRDKGIPVFFTRTAYNEDYSDSGILLEGAPEIIAAKGLVRGDWDADIAVTIDISDEEEKNMIVDKIRSSAFWKTDFEQRLRDRGVNQLLVTGVVTNVCVESTARDSFSNGFHTLTVSDATAALTEEEQKASLKTLEWFGGTASVSEIQEALKHRKSTST